MTNYEIILQQLLIVIGLFLYSSLRTNIEREILKIFNTTQHAWKHFTENNVNKFESSLICETRYFEKFMNINIFHSLHSTLYML